MKREDLEKINTLFKFLNDMGSQMTEKMARDSRKHFKELVREIYETTADMRDTLAKEMKKNKIDLKLPEIKFPDVNLPKVEIMGPPKVSLFPKFPEFPKKFSIEEAADIIDVLTSIVQEVKKFKIDLKPVEKGLFDLQVKLGIEIDKLKKSIPKVPKIDIPKLPMEKGRIKVILPNEQVMRTPLGEKMTKAVRGIFMGGETNNPIARLANKTGTQINPATEDGNLANLSYLPGLAIPTHDYIELGYTGSNLTSVIYKSGGSGGTTVATLTLAYDGSDNLTSITKS